MNRKYSLKKNHDIEKLIKRKQSVGNKYYAIYFNFQKEEMPKIALSISKKLGKAVERNYQKRVTREIVRSNLTEFANIMCLIVIKSTTLDLSFLEKKEQLEYLIKKMNQTRRKKIEK